MVLRSRIASRATRSSHPQMARLASSTSLAISPEKVALESGAIAVPRCLLFASNLYSGWRTARIPALMICTCCCAKLKALLQVL